MNIDEVGEHLEAQGLSDEEIDDFLEHHGVKGQKWGVRRQKKQMAALTKTARKRSALQQVVKTNKTERRVATGATFIATRLVGKKLGLSTTQLNAASAGSAVLVNSLMRKHGALKLAQIQP